MADRWFLVPIVTGPLGGDHPKYYGTTGISGWGGQIVTINGTDKYTVRYVGTTSALDTIESNSDATSQEESGLSKPDVASYLNTKTGHNYSFSEWGKRFLTGDVNN